jgi:hypothetical protein
MQPLYHLTYLLCCMCRIILFHFHLVMQCSSVVDQVTQFNDYLASEPAGATWNSKNSLFAIWIGINDVVRTFFIVLSTSIINVTYPGQFFRLGG